MRNRRTSAEHQEAVSRRLTQLSDELAAARAAVGEETRERPLEAAVGAEWWDGHTRVAPAPLSLVPPVPPVPPPVARPSPVRIPPPGRHASRRATVELAAWVPDTLRGRTMLGPAQVAVVAVVVALGLAVTLWWVVRSDPDPPTLPLAGSTAATGDLVPVEVPDPSAPAPAPADAGTPGSTGVAATTVTVDVAGKVRRPGIVVLDAGSRVVDALERAGGARPGVDVTSLNLARLLVDGEQLLVGVEGAPVTPVGVPLPPATDDTGLVPTALVDLNLASQAELEELPEVGPVTASAIIGWREEHGGFTAVTELLEVAGIGDATLAQLTPLVTV